MDGAITLQVPTRGAGEQTILSINPVEYDQWQRTRKPSKVLKEQDTLPRRRPKSVSIRPSSPKEFTVSSGGTRFKEHKYAGPACAHDHGRRIKSALSETAEDLREKETQKEIRILNLLIKARLKALENYKAREETLLLENTKLRLQIENSEREVHHDVKSLLQKYERYRGAVSTLNVKFEKEKSSAKADFEKAKEKAKRDVAVLQAQVEEADAELTLRKDELAVLLGYKDRDYPVRAMRISELQREIRTMTEDFKEEKDELEKMIALEKEKYMSQNVKDLENLKAEATDNAMDSLQDGLKVMAYQNITMRREIENHVKENEFTEKSLPLLQEEIKRLKIDPKTNVRKQMFPHLFKEMPKCTPDMDVVLDIPTQEWLPI